MPKRHWIYLNGKDNPEIEIPLFKKEGKPIQFKPPIPKTEQQPPKSRVNLEIWQNFNMIFSGHINQPAKINSKGLSKDRNLEKRVRPQDLTEKENEEFNLEAIEAEWIE